MERGKERGDDKSRLTSKGCLETLMDEGGGMVGRAKSEKRNKLVGWRKSENLSAITVG